MSVPTATSILVDLGETFVSYGLPPLSILTVCGAFKRLRNPWIRGSAFVFTATTQALWERDMQIEHRRAMAKGAQKNKGAIYWRRYYMVPGEIHEWDSTHGQSEIHHRIDTLYSPNAIFIKSLACGITLGTLPLLLKAPVFVTDLWNYLAKKEFPARSLLEIFADDTFNRWYAWSVGSRPFLDPSHREIVNWMHIYAVRDHEEDMNKQGWVPKPQRWYSRKGKLPIFQYNVEEESYP